MNKFPHACTPPEQVCCERWPRKRYRWRWLLLAFSAISLMGIIVILSGSVVLGSVLLVTGILLNIVLLLAFLLRKTARIKRQLHVVTQQLESMSEAMRSRQSITCGPDSVDVAALRFRPRVLLHETLAEDDKRHLAELKENRERRDIRHVPF